MFSAFISSTNEDLKEYRKEAAMGAHGADMHADLQENWTAEDHPPLDACLERVRKADVLVVIVAYRCGWVPDDVLNPDAKSITWLECEEAEKHHKHILAFVIDDSTDWPEHLKDEADLKRAADMEDDEAADALYKGARERIKKLKFVGCAVRTQIHRLCSLHVSIPSFPRSRR